MSNNHSMDGWPNHNQRLAMFPKYTGVQFYYVRGHVCYRAVHDFLLHGYDYSIAEWHEGIHEFSLVPYEPHKITAPVDQPSILEPEYRQLNIDWRRGEP